MTKEKIDVLVEMSPVGAIVGSLRNMNSMQCMDNPESVDGSIASVRGPARSLVSSVRNADGSVKKVSSSFGSLFPSFVRFFSIF